MLGAGAGARLVQVFSGKEHQLVTRCTWAGSEPFPGLAWPGLASPGEAASEEGRGCLRPQSVFLVPV